MSFASQPSNGIWECFQIREYNNCAEERAHVFIFRSIRTWFQCDIKRLVVDGMKHRFAENDPIHRRESFSSTIIYLFTFYICALRTFNHVTLSVIRFTILFLFFIQFRMDTIKIGLNCNGFMKGKSTIHIDSEFYAL